MRLSRLAVALLPAAAAFFIWPTAAPKQRGPQLTPAETAAILRAAVDSGWHLLGVLDFRVVDDGDAAELVIEQTPPHPPGDSIFVPRFGYVRDLVRVVRRVERQGRRWRATKVEDRNAPAFPELIVPALPQSPSTGIEILRTATADSAERLAGYRIGGDTAWATLVNSHDLALISSQGIPGQEVRLEPRGSAWVRVSSRSVLLRPPSRGADDTAPAESYKLTPPPRP